MHFHSFMDGLDHPEPFNDLEERLEDIDLYIEGFCKPHLVDDLWQQLMTLLGLPEILCRACSNRSKCEGHVLVPLLRRLQGSRGRDLPILSQLGNHDSSIYPSGIIMP